MHAIWTLAKKDLRLLLRDPKAAIILLIMPLVFILVLGASLGEDRVRVSIVDLDHGKWSAKVLEDLRHTAGIDVEVLPDRDEAEQLIRNNRRAAVLVFGPRFSERVEQCSFLPEGVNPFYHNGIDLRALDAEILRDETQLLSASIIEQVAQGTLLRVVLPWMIGQAFSEIGKPSFVDRLSKDKTLQMKLPFAKVIDKMATDPNFKGLTVKYLGIKMPIQVVFAGLTPQDKTKLAEAMQKTFTLQEVLHILGAPEKKQLAAGLQNTLQGLFAKYDLTAKDWAQLTKSPPATGSADTAGQEKQILGSGVLRLGAIRYQKVVPSYTVMFAFFLVLNGGWLFVAERRQGTLKRLSAAPLMRAQILLGKLLPCFLVSLLQGSFLLLAGNLIFGMKWGEQPWLLIPVVVTTSFAAMGMALFIASLARTETQVAIYGTLLVLVLAGLSGALLGDRAMMPQAMEQISRITPHAWALDAYQQLLAPPSLGSESAAPNLEVVARSCAVLTAFGLGFLALAWGTLKLE